LPSSSFSATSAHSFVLSFLPHFDIKGMFFVSPRLFFFVAFHHCVLNCLGLFTFYALLCSSAPPFFSVLLSSFLGFLAWVAFFKGFVPFSALESLVKTPFLSSFSSYLFAP